MDEDDRELTKDDRIYDLVDVIKEGPDEVLSGDILDDKIIETVSKVAERVAREMFPSIAEKVIREEIDKLKEDSGE
jgi:DNA-binding NarL/FixJ family response regulator